MTRASLLLAAALLVAVVVAPAVAGCSAKASATAAAAAPPKIAGYHAYDEGADGAAQIAAAERQAKAEHKRVLVQFGGNWCQWCAALDHALARPELKPIVDASFVVVHVDANHNGALNEKYDQLYLRGFPVLLVLDADGAVVHIQETGSLERDDKSLGHDVGKVKAFLDRWRG